MISVNGKIVAADGITGLGPIETYARRTGDAVRAFQHKQLSKAATLRIVRESAEMMLTFVTENEGIPTVAEFQEAEAVS